MVQAQQTAQKIMASVQRVTAIVSEIALASNEQAAQLAQAVSVFILGRR